MGGKIWNRNEERIFWRVIMAQCPNRVGVDRTKLEVSWDDLTKEMVRSMAKIEDDKRREYTTLCLFEHYFLNVVQGCVSPNAGKYVKEYMNKMSPEERALVETEAKREAVKREEKRAKRDAQSRRDKKMNHRNASARVTGVESESETSSLPNISMSPGNTTHDADADDSSHQAAHHGHGSPSNAGHSPLSQNSSFLPSTQGTSSDQPSPATPSTPVSNNSASSNNLPGVSSIVSSGLGSAPVQAQNDRFMPRDGHSPVMNYNGGQLVEYHQANQTYYRPDPHPYYDPQFGHSPAMGPNFGHGYGYSLPFRQNVSQGYPASYHQDYRYQHPGPVQQNYGMPDHISAQHAEPRHRGTSHQGSSQQSSVTQNSDDLYSAQYGQYNAGSLHGAVYRHYNSDGGQRPVGHHNAASSQQPVGHYNAAGSQQPIGHSNAASPQHDGGLGHPPHHPGNYSYGSASGSAPGSATQAPSPKTPSKGAGHIVESIETPTAGQTVTSQPDLFELTLRS
ncbi:hypothetical protein B0H67DRAFT_552592 [Lasiosphaeris hirsuta]|uniref:Uncharacterized protein n=1 Tax=Lasiosphaeris hirsuta TaxID=260670 RepID=A0AA40DYJ0_9PEZI|nr:hypothetical protein B0H67DRAFT_552592 [Lasiosphaeris hirsuta]